jgi:L-2-hydroxyglutarate oxidase LhgO
MKIAVIGGGVFGAMTAARLAEVGETVSLFERLPALMQGTTSVANRLHQGFHYPRDDETARPMHARLRSFQGDLCGGHSAGSLAIGHIVRHTSSASVRSPRKKR